MNRVLIMAQFYNRHGNEYSVTMHAYTLADAPGLTIHHDVSRVNGEPLVRWRITHMVTGMQVGDMRGYRTLDRAINAAEELAQGVDWTQAAVVLNEYTDEQGCGRVAITG